MITAPGVGSGLDVSSIVDQLMSIERLPLRRMESDKQGLEAQLSAFGKLKSSLTTFQSAFENLKTLDSFEIYKAESSNEAAFTATADSTAAIGFNSVQVVSLAESHKMGSVAIADTDTTTLGGAGDQMTFTINGNAFTVDVGGLTLSGIRDAINDATDNTGVSASIISENASSNRLVLTSTETGNANVLNISSTGSVGTALGLTDINDPAQLDSEMLIDGLYTVTRSSNIINDAISGITLTLLSETTSADQLTVSRDVESVQESVQSFVDSFNELNTLFDSLSGEGNDLEADNTLRSIENQIRAVFNTPPSGLTGSYSYLSEVGVSFQRNGTLSLDAAALETAINSDFSGMAEMFANDNQGYLFRIDSLIDNFVQADGLINVREDGINTRIDTTEQRILDMEYRLEIREQRLLSQFNTLDSLMGQLNGTSAFLTQQLAALPSLG
ncbi:flagellar hook-associated protein 2 [Thiogranum longum]|uniref:Flagellar hook-associated protein 2 n=1 Tax=Thiogranum longum TaxID=1537524 RepID=A0A4R1HDY0_9GAMM|nr:flagellar filament capping protein FliD [Thiogranum longum]TCK18853.1 flagellar hook-associated protein 2 [Thiogranum longum]